MKRGTMKTQDAIIHILDKDKSANQYRLSKAFGCSHTTIKNYIDGKTSMSEKVYEKFKEIYPGIEISDVYSLPKYELGLK